MQRGDKRDQTGKCLELIEPYRLLAVDLTASEESKWYFVGDT